MKTSWYGVVRVLKVEVANLRRLGLFSTVKRVLIVYLVLGRHFRDSKPNLP